MAIQAPKVDFADRVPDLGNLVALELAAHQAREIEEKDKLIDIQALKAEQITLKAD